MKMALREVAHGERVTSTAKKYGIPPGTLWDIVYKDENGKKQTKENIEEAVREITHGSTITSVSLKYRIPVSVLRYELNRSQGKELNAKLTKLKHEKQGTDLDMKNASLVSTNSSEDVSSVQVGTVFSTNTTDSLFFSSICYEMDSLPLKEKYEFKQNVLNLLHVALKKYGL